MVLTPEKLRVHLGKIDRDTLLSVRDAVTAAGNRYVFHARSSGTGDRRTGPGILAHRRKNLETLVNAAADLEQALVGIDSLTREDFELQLGHESRERLIGYLREFGVVASRHLKSAQTSGNPADPNLDRWVNTIADLYEHYAGGTAAVWGGDANPGPFFRFLEACRPDEFASHGELKASRVRSILKRRKALRLSRASAK